MKNKLERKQEMSKKVGANKSDQLAISRLHNEGLKAAEISDELRIAVNVVESFLPKPKPKPKAKPKKKVEGEAPRGED